MNPNGCSSSGSSPDHLVVGIETDLCVVFDVLDLLVIILIELIIVCGLT